MLQGLRPKLAAEGMKFSKQLGPVELFGAPIGDFGTEYAYRALVAIAGLGANTVEIALYPKTEKDADGNPLTGEKSYNLHLESDRRCLTAVSGRSLHTVTMISSSIICSTATASTTVRV